MHRIKICSGYQQLRRLYESQIIDLQRVIFFIDLLQLSLIEINLS